MSTEKKHNKKQLHKPGTDRGFLAISKKAYEVVKMYAEIKGITITQAAYDLLQLGLTSELEKKNNFIKEKKHGYQIDRDTSNKRTYHKVEAVIKEIRLSKPEMTKEEVLKLLISQNFDFEYVSPRRTVNMAWINLDRFDNDIREKFNITK